MSFLSVQQRVCCPSAAVPRAPRRSPISSSSLSSPLTRRASVVAKPPTTTRHLRAPLHTRAPLRTRASSFSVDALAGAELAEEDEPEEEDSTPSDGEVVPTSSRLLPPGGGGGPRVAGALPSSSSLFASSGLKVLVVGATGRTGRMIVSRLVAEGVPCRCLVRSVARAREALPESSTSSGLVTLVRGDLTQPASLPLALADCNAVVWAAGVPSLVAMFKDPLAPLRVEAEGVANLVAAFERARRGAAPSSPPRFVLISSIGADNVLAQLAFPGGVLFWKKRGELALQRSSVLDWTIIRPGGLKDGDSSSSSSEGGVVAVGPDGIGFPSLFSSSTSSSSRPPRQRPGSISRKAVADLAVDALVVPAAVGKVVEVVSRKDAPRRGAEELFSNAEQN